MSSMQEVGNVSFVVEHGVGTFCNEHFKRLPRSLQTGLVPKLTSSSRLQKMHISAQPDVVFKTVQCLDDLVHNKKCSLGHQTFAYCGLI